MGDRVVVKFTGQNFSAPKVIGFESNPKPCNEYAVISFMLYQEEWVEGGDPINPSIVTRQRVLLWDLSGEKVGVVPGLTFPCDPTDPLWVEWLAGHTSISDPLFEVHDRGTTYNGGSGPPSSLVDPMLPELDLPESTYFNLTATGEWYDWAPPEPPMWMETLWAASFGYAAIAPKVPGNTYAGCVGYLLKSLIPSAPAGSLYSAFRISAAGTLNTRGWGLQYYPADSWDASVTFTVHTPFGILTTYNESYQGYYESAPPGYYTGPWPLNRAPQPLPVHIDPNAPCERQFIQRTHASAKSETSIVNLFIQQRRNTTITPGAYYPSDTLIFDHLAGGYGPRIISVHAQAVTPQGGVAGKNFVTLGRTAAFESAIISAIQATYLNLDLTDSENIWTLSLSTSIVR